MRNITRFALASVVVAGGASFVACEPNQRQAREGEQQQQTQQEEGVISETVEPVRGLDVSDTEVSEDEATVEARKRVVTRQVVEYEIPTIEVCEERVNINEMEEKHFVALGVPQQAAQRIVQHREQNGPFDSVSELSQIPGVDQQALSQLRGQAGVKP